MTGYVDVPPNYPNDYEGFAAWARRHCSAILNHPHSIPPGNVYVYDPPLECDTPGGCGEFKCGGAH